MDKFLTYMKENWPVWTLIVLIFFGLLFVVISYLVANKRDARYEKTLEDQRTSVRVFVIDVPNDNVCFFNVTDMRHVRSMSLGDFYRNFPLDEQTKVIKWINAIADPKTETPTYLETNVLIHGAKRQYFSMLQVDHVDYKTGKIHLESYLLKYMARCIRKPSIASIAASSRSPTSKNSTPRSIKAVMPRWRSAARKNANSKSRNSLMAAPPAASLKKR